MQLPYKEPSQTLLQLMGIVVQAGQRFASIADSQVGDMNQAAAVGTTVALLERGSRVMSAIPMSGVVEHYDRRTAIRYLTSGDVVLFSAGTGNPFFTTDSAACLRGIEVDVDVVIKATKVDGVYNKDPVKHPDAVKCDQLSYDDALDQKLGVMDLTAICLVRDHDMPVRVFDMNKPGALLNLVVGGKEGTLIDRG
jgi:uridylate kinase